MKNREFKTKVAYSDVLGVLEHEFKTPLTAILTSSAGLAELGGLSSAQDELVALIDERAWFLNRLTSRLLLSARLDAEDIAINLIPVSVEPIVDEVVVANVRRFGGGKILAEIEDDRLTLCCDRQLLLHLLTEYLDNACKYAVSGTAITIRAVEVKGDVVFSVHNFGPAVPIRMRRSIFENNPLTRSSGKRGIDGGFGLSIVRRIALIHRGSVTVTSDEREGTTFFAVIPQWPKKSSL